MGKICHILFIITAFVGVSACTSMSTPPQGQEGIPGVEEASTREVLTFTPTPSYHVALHARKKESARKALVTAQKIGKITAHKGDFRSKKSCKIVPATLANSDGFVTFKTVMTREYTKSCGREVLVIAKTHQRHKVAVTKKKLVIKALDHSEAPATEEEKTD